MEDIKLYYFNARGRAEPMRLCLVAAGRKFEDIRLNAEEWAAQKDKAPYGEMPYIVYKGKAYGESKALASFIARECGMAGKNSEEALRVDEVFCLVSSLIEVMAKAYFEKDPDLKAALQKQLAEETVPKYLGFFEKLLKESGTGYFVGTALTLADVTVQNITFGMLKRNPNRLDGFPEIQRMVKNVESDKNVKAYLAARPDTEM